MDNYGRISASEIGRRLGRGKNAVIGAARRFGLCQSASSDGKPWRPGDPIPPHLRILP